MSAPSNVLWVALIGSVAFGLFQIKHAVQRLEDELAGLNRELLASEESIHVLRAEWSYLNRPERLAVLAARHLDLEPLAPAQIGVVEALPLRADIARLADAGTAP